METELDDALFSILTADAGVSALCGARVYPAVAEPGAALPYVVYEQPDDAPVQALDRTTDLRRASYTIDCYGAGRAEAKALRRAVAAALEDYRGDSPGGAFAIRALIVEGGEADVELPSPGDELPVHRAGLNVLAGYCEN